MCVCVCVFDISGRSLAGLLLHTRIHTYIHTYMHAFIHTYIHTYIHTHTHIHACIHTYIHSHVHAPTQIKNGNFCAHVHQHSQALLKSTSSLLRSDSLTDRAIAIAVGEKTFMSAHSTWRQAQMRAHECLNKDSLSHMQPEHLQKTTIREDSKCPRKKSEFLLQNMATYTGAQIPLIHAPFMHGRARGRMSLL